MYVNNDVIVNCTFHSSTINCMWTILSTTRRRQVERVVTSVCRKREIVTCELTSRLYQPYILHLYRDAPGRERIAFFTRRRVDMTSRVLSDSVRLGSIRPFSARLGSTLSHDGYDDGRRAIDRSGFREIIITPVEIYLATRGTYTF